MSKKEILMIGQVWPEGGKTIAHLMKSLLIFTNLERQADLSKIWIEISFKPLDL